MEDLDLKKNFWKGRRVFITGHTGFKGSWLSLWLSNWGAKLTGYSLEPSTQPSLFETIEINKDVNNLFENVCDYKTLSKALQEAQPEIVFHLAAQPLVLKSYLDPIETYNTNVMGTVNLLEAIRKVKSVKAVLVITSDKCYENKEWIWPYRENEPMGGHDPYSSSKGCAELVTSAFRNSYFTDSTTAIASVRAGNVIGGGDWSENRLIPDIIAAILKNEALELRNPNSVRPWQHVLEPLNGYILLAEKMFYENSKYSEAWNFGPANENHKEVSHIISRFEQLWGSKLNIKSNSDSAKKHEASLLKLDSTKANTKLNWLPRLSLDETLSYIVDWHKAYIKKENMRLFTTNQIDNFIKKAV
jgi:CDP-glucose 4,6-dehydratase